MTPLAQSKVYAHTLARPEAKALRPYLRLASQWPSTEQSDIGSHSMDVLARVARLVLTDSTLLDLRDLSLVARGRVSPDWRQVFAYFGAEGDVVRRLDLRHNELSSAFYRLLWRCCAHKQVYPIYGTSQTWSR